MRILLLCTAFNGLTQRAWIELRERGHDVSVHQAGGEEDMRRAVRLAEPDLVICPYLRERVPAQVWRECRTIIIHPGPPGDRGPSALDWAITDAEPVWGVTALQAVEELDAGPVWAARTFPLAPGEAAQPPRKSRLYNTSVADAAVELICEVVTRAAEPRFVPRRLAPGRFRPAMRQADRLFDWSEPTADILRRVRAADGSPGVRGSLCGLDVSLFDAHPGIAPTPGAPGTVALRGQGAVLVRTGDTALWVGHLRRMPAGAGSGVKLPAATVLGRRLDGVPQALPAPGYPEIAYRRIGAVGVLSFDFYNGAMSTSQCRRLATALRRAAAQDTRALLLRGGEVFSNGVNLNVIEAAPHPALEAWRNIIAIDDVCREILSCSNQLVMACVGGNAGAGGVMLALAADRVLLHRAAVLNPHYRSMGLHGSEYWTYTLPRRVGSSAAASLAEQCLPVGSAQAARIGLVDEVIAGPRAEFEQAALERAAALAGRRDHADLLAAKSAAREADERTRPLETYRVQELAEMSRDLFDDRLGFAAARHGFVTKRGRSPVLQRSLAG